MKYEDISNEYKERITPEIEKTVVAFANTDGGTLYIGVANDGHPVGVDNPDQVILQLTNMIRDSIRPDITMFTNVNIEKIDDKSVVVLHVQKGTASPYYINGKGIRPGGVYLRRGSSSVPASEAAILKMIKESSSESYEEMRSIVQELTFTETSQIFKQEGLSFKESQMRTLGLIDRNGMYTNVALLLSEQNPHTIKIAAFEDKSKNIFKDRYEFRGSLFEQLEEAIAFINRYNSTRSRIEGIRRVDQRDYPPEAIREVLLNAIIHRDYSYSAPSLISIFIDRIEFVTIGGLAKGITLADIELGISITRNKLLANIFYRLGFVEAYGTGIPKVRACYANNLEEPKIEVSNNAFKITLPKIEEGAKKISSEIFTTNDEVVLTKLEQETLNLFNGVHYIKRKDIEESLDIGVTSAYKIIKSLEEKGYIEREGDGRSTRYVLVEKK